jgi:hypothetical protein
LESLTDVSERQIQIMGPVPIAGDRMNETAAIFGFILLGLTWLALRKMDARKPRSRSRR